MKRLTALVLTLVLLWSVSGCNSAAIEGASFYYRRSPEASQYFEENSIIVPETRDLSGHQGDLQYMLSLYLAGPLEEAVFCPFPSGTRLLSVRKIVGTIRIELSDLDLILSDSEFSLGCACLTLTCMDFMPCTEVIIDSGNRRVTMNADNLILFDSAVPDGTAGG